MDAGHCFLGVGACRCLITCACKWRHLAYKYTLSKYTCWSAHVILQFVHGIIIVHIIICYYYLSHVILFNDFLLYVLFPGSRQSVASKVNPVLNLEMLLRAVKLDTYTSDTLSVFFNMPRAVCMKHQYSNILPIANGTISPYLLTYIHTYISSSVVRQVAYEPLELHNVGMTWRAL